MQLVTAARDLNLLNETLQKWAGNAIAVLQPDGWKGRKLAQEMKLNEAMVHRKKKAQDEKEGKGKKKKRPGDDSSDDEDGRGGADGRPPWF